ncbi:molybdopterin synthase sulfur carrier subunit [Sinomonas atrocyanea]
MSVTVVVPSVLAPASGGRTQFELPDASARSVREALDAVGRDYPVLGRRIRDERGELRRHVNVYVDGEDVRRGGALRPRSPRGRKCSSSSRSPADSRPQHADM